MPSRYVFAGIVLLVMVLLVLLSMLPYGGVV